MGIELIVVKLATERIDILRSCGGGKISRPLNMRVSGSGQSLAVRGFFLLVEPFFDF
jgi:hypothetical protein